MKNLRHQHIYDLAEVCAQHGIRHAVICPGSRSAPLVLGFSNHRAIRSLVIPDERTAGFIGLGIAQATKTPVVLICTSGTAAYHFAPAVTEAFYQEIPLIICTADRPGEWIGQRDGQTIVQNRIYGMHVKAFFDVQAEDQPEGSWLANRMMNEAILMSKSVAPGPVHLNFPFREPLYPSPSEVIRYGKQRIIGESVNGRLLDPKELKGIIKKISTNKRILIIAGQSNISNELRSLINRMEVPVIIELTSNLNGIKQGIRNADMLLGAASVNTKMKLRPQLLISWGNGVVSKQLKIFLRNYKAVEHWHIQEGGNVADTFKQLTRIFRCKPEYFLQEVFQGFIKKVPSTQKAYLDNWKSLDTLSGTIIRKELKDSFSEATAVMSVLEKVTENHDLHLANSMSVRHANLAGLPGFRKNIEVFSNRGTSGIDGCTATAVGHQLVKKRPQVLITGDVAFFYDSNAFWHDEKVENLRICLINNHGGRIFQIIDGPKGRKETERFFVGPQSRTAETFCKENSISYLKLSGNEMSDSSSENQLKQFFKSGKDVRLLEIFCEPGRDAEVLERIKIRLKESIK